MAKLIHPYILLGLLLAASAALLSYRFPKPSREAVLLKARPNRTVAAVLKDLQPNLHRKAVAGPSRSAAPPSQTTPSRNCSTWSPLQI